MNEENDNIFVITKEQAAELLSKSSFNKEQVNNVKFSSILLVSIVIFIICLTTPVILLIQTPVFFIEYLVKKIFERKEEVKNENNNTSN
jgi:hypothetical protein